MRALTIAVGDHGLTRPLKEGAIGARGIELQFCPVNPIVAAMRRMVRQLEFDICEMAFATYLCAKAHGKPITAIPVFLTRNFHHRAIFYNVKSGIKEPKDLEGRTVGVHRGYTVTTGLWARGVLRTEYGVDLGSITWAPTDDEHVAEYEPPTNVNYSLRGGSMSDLLVSGKVCAAVGDLRVDCPDVRPLIPDARQAGFDSFLKTGVYPINHGLVIKNSCLEADPNLPANLFNSFSEAKTVYLNGLERGICLSPADQAAIDVRSVVGDPFPFGISANRRAIHAIIQLAFDQRLIPKKFSPEELFVSGVGS
jgi:4,5-dihydroxyphthalate decarboxylase